MHPHIGIDRVPFANKPLTPQIFDIKYLSKRVWKHNRIPVVTSAEGNLGFLKETWI